MSIQVIENAEGTITPRQLREFIDQLPSEALDQPIIMNVDGGEAQVDEVVCLAGVLRLY